MEKFEALWAYQEEDMKADAIAAAIKRSPTRQKLEKARDFILDRQKQYKQIEEDVAAMVDRKDIIAQAITRSREQLGALQSRFEANPPHLEDKQLLVGAEAVLEDAHEPEDLPSVALQGDDRVHHVLEHPRTGQGAVLGDVAHDDARGAEPATGLDDQRRDGAHLRDVAGEPVCLKACQGLHGVEYEQLGLEL